MKLKFLLFIIFFISFVKLLAQSPTWKVNESDYQFTMTLVSKLNMDGVFLTNQNDMVGAFVGNTCRGYSKLTYNSNRNAYYAYLTVFSNTSGEVINFQIYNSTNNKISKVSKTINFIADYHVGDLFQSYSIAEPALNNKSDLLTFDFLNIKKLSSSITNRSINLNISESYSLNSLIPVFTLSKGASLFKNQILQKSGVTASNFSSPVIFDVLSEDESTLTTYTVSVTQSPDPPLFYKKDAVCTTLGAIKVVSKRIGIVKLSNNGKEIGSKSLTNGEAIFSGLISGTYIATVGNDFKVITINHKR